MELSVVSSTSSVYEKVWTSMDSLVVDCQVFYKSRNPGDVFIKEIAAYEIQAERIYHVLLSNPEIIDPSCRNLAENIRLVQERHGIYWDSGNIQYNEGLRRFIQLCKPFRFIYTVGSMMKYLFENLLQRVVYDLSEHFIPSTEYISYYFGREYYIHCPCHRGELALPLGLLGDYPSCSQRNAFLNGLWMKHRGPSADLSTSEGRLVTFFGGLPEIDFSIVVAGFCMGANRITGRKEVYCTHCGFVETDVEDSSYVLWAHKVSSLICHLKNYVDLV